MVHPEKTRFPRPILLLTYSVVIFIIGYKIGKANEWESRELWVRGDKSASELLWAESVDKRKRSAQESFNGDNDPWGTSGFKTIWDYFYPSYNCPYLTERIGILGDGGKFLCGLQVLSEESQRRECVVYSYGVAGEVSFEKEILDRTNCKVFMFDHTINDTPELVNQYPGRAVFTKSGLSNVTSRMSGTLKSHMDAFGHKYIQVLKMDIEGSEFGSMDKALEDFSGAAPFRQFLVEIHLDSLPKNAIFSTLHAWWTRLESAGLRAYHNELNLLMMTRQIHKEPKLCEYSFYNTKPSEMSLLA